MTPDLTAAPAPLTHRARVLLWHGRWPLRLLAAGFVALAAVRTVAPPAEPTAPVLVAAREVLAGTTLGREHLRTVQVPRRLVPDGAFSSPDAVLGRRALQPLARGLPLTPAAVADDRFDVAPPPGHVVAAVHLEQGPGDSVLRAGDVVELVTARSGGDAAGRPVAEVVAGAALVVGVRVESEQGLLSGGAGADAVTLLALTPTDGRRLAAVLGDAPLTALLVPGSGGPG